MADGEGVGVEEGKGDGEEVGGGVAVDVGVGVCVGGGSPTVHAPERRFSRPTSRD